MGYSGVLFDGSGGVFSLVELFGADSGSEIGSSYGILDGNIYVNVE